MIIINIGSAIITVENETEATLDIEKNGDYDFTITNVLDIHAVDIEPGWNGKYILTIRNDANYAVAYKLVWQKVSNTYTETNNLDYRLIRNNTSYLNDLKAPYQNITLKDELLIRPKTTIKYLIDINFRETGINQNIDSGKTFSGQFNAIVIKK